MSSQPNNDHSDEKKLTTSSSSDEDTAHMERWNADIAATEREMADEEKRFANHVEEYLDGLNDILHEHGCDPDQINRALAVIEPMMLARASPLAIRDRVRALGFTDVSRVLFTPVRPPPRAHHPGVPHVPRGPAEMHG